jgi:hypothetical protein
VGKLSSCSRRIGFSQSRRSHVWYRYRCERDGAAGDGLSDEAVKQQRDQMRALASVL